jgi:17beta-estradiol 17-dehydrogenase / very-long-chain 3-oxoacyl-CoA reductase
MRPASAQVRSDALVTELLTIILSLSLCFVVRFAESLSSEYASQGIDVQVQNPLYVTSKLSKIRKASLTVPSPAAYARASLNAVGYESQTSPFFLHAAQIWFMSLLPRSLLDSQVTNMHRSIRKRALKKAQEAKDAPAAAQE